MAEQERILIVGCGYVGSALGVRLAKSGKKVWGMRRSVQKIPASISPIQADIGDPATLSSLPDVDVVVYAVSAGGFEEERYRLAYVDGVRHLLDAYKDRPPRRFFFVSSTSVYAQVDDEWVDETSPTQPTHFSGRCLLEGESMLCNAPIASTIVRLSGIYGPGRTRLLDSVRAGSATYHPTQKQYTNRIHRDDCAGMLQHLIGLDEVEERYVGVDHEPAPKKEVLSWLATQMNVSPPQPSEEISKGRRGRSQKRCRNKRIVDAGYTFAYPTFREGYTEMMAALGYLHTTEE